MSTTPHKARTEVWAAVERFSRNEMDIMNCVLELRARVEALEREAAMNELRAASAEARPAPSGSLVERVMDAGGMGLPESARAAIREIAAWMRDRGGYPWAWVAMTLEKEAER